MLYDYSKLLGIMRQKGYSQEAMAAKIGISPCSMNLKLNNKSEFRQDEMTKICLALDIPLIELTQYFFTH